METTSVTKSPANQQARKLWKSLCHHSRFADAPYKIETNAQGQIIRSPTRNFHGFYAAEIDRLLQQPLLEGKVIVECAVDTSDGTKEAHVGWFTADRFALVMHEFSSSIAPEICVEVLSSSNTLQEIMGKRDLYLEAGAVEYWLCNEKGLTQFFDASGALAQSKLCPEFPHQIET